MPTLEAPLESKFSSTLDCAWEPETFSGCCAPCFPDRGNHMWATAKPPKPIKVLWSGVPLFIYLFLLASNSCTVTVTVTAVHFGLSEGPHEAGTYHRADIRQFTGKALPRHRIANMLQLMHWPHNVQNNVIMSTCVRTAGIPPQNLPSWLRLYNLIRTQHVNIFLLYSVFILTLWQRLVTISHRQVQLTVKLYGYIAVGLYCIWIKTYWSPNSLLLV